MSPLNGFLICPKCGERMLGKSSLPKLGREYFAHCCHTYFGTDELVRHWGYDAGDFFPIPDITPDDNSFYQDEPLWKNKQEREDAYRMVQRMYLGIPEKDDYRDMIETYLCALDIGIQ